MGLETYRRQVAETKHAAILEAAQNEFLEKGFSRAAMVDISKKADVSTATLYKHFRSKEELFDAIIDQTFSTLANHLTPDQFGFTIEDAARMPIEDVLTRVGLVILRIQRDQRINDLMRVVIAEAVANPALGRNFYQKTLQTRHNMLVEFLNLLVSQGRLKMSDTDIGAQIIMGTFKEIFIWPDLFDPERNTAEDSEPILRRALKIFIEAFDAK